MMSRVSALIVCTLAAFAAAANMNGDYVLSNTPKSDVSKYPTQYEDFPRPVEYFDIYSPLISQLYSQVYWTGMEPVDLPKEIVDRFHGKGMVVVGFEMDQVFRGNTSEEDISIPITTVYNHHHETTMTGAKSTMEKVTDMNDPRIANMGHHHPHEDYVMVVKNLAPGNALPTSIAVGAANGGEYRKSYHGFAPGFGKVIESPQQLHVTPMQIDTWNRDKMNKTGHNFVSGPVPRNSLAPKEGVDAIYSGLLECPLTTRIKKIVEGSYTSAVTGTCENNINSFSVCFGAATQLGLPSTTTFKDVTGTNSSLPAGCTISSINGGKNVTVFYNSLNTSSVPCGKGVTSTFGTTESLVTLSVQLDSSKDNVTITMTGPSAYWFGVGFNASAMKDGPWAIIVDGNGAVTERKLADQNPGTQLKSSVTVISHSVSGDKRTVVMTRPFVGLTPDHYTFDLNKDTALNFINAIGKTVDLQYHANRTAASIALLPVGDAPACVCAHEPAPFGEAKGSLVYTETGTRVGFGNHCAPQPRTDLLAQKNPTCDVRTYVGGQTACHHMWSLLDADQEIPWQDQPLEYHLKFRFWFQEYNASYHTNVERTTWGIASPVEYDVPQCAPGTPTKDCIHKITGTFTVRGPGSGKKMKLVAAHYHCHAPTCLDLTFYDNATGEVICREVPIYGQGKEDKFDERGYIAQPPCLWGDAEFGLEPPYDIGGKTVYVVKHSNSTYGHHGEMAWNQMHYIIEDE